MYLLTYSGDDSLPVGSQPVEEGGESAHCMPPTIVMSAEEQTAGASIVGAE